MGSRVRPRQQDFDCAQLGAFLNGAHLPSSSGAPIGLDDSAEGARSQWPPWVATV